MAGAGKRTFVAGEVLTAAQVNDYLMDQAVMRFSGSAARAASITAPTEGMVTYLDDRGRLEIYNGSAWVIADPRQVITSSAQVLVGVSAGSVVAVGPGAEGQVLTRLSTASAGVAWVQPPGGGDVALATVNSLSTNTALSTSLSAGYYRISTNNAGTYNSSQFRFVDTTGNFYGATINNGIGLFTIPVGVASVNVTSGTVPVQILAEEVSSISSGLISPPSVSSASWVNFNGGTVTVASVPSGAASLGVFSLLTGSFTNLGPATASTYSACIMGASTGVFGTAYNAAVVVSSSATGVWSISQPVATPFFPFQLFDANSNYVPPPWSTKADFFVVSGGGGGGGIASGSLSGLGGGGGAGGASIFTNVPTPGPVSITIGSFGGAGAAGKGGNGSSSSVTIGATVLSTTGGGGGGAGSGPQPAANFNGNAGGSGGGAGMQIAIGPIGSVTAGTGGAGTAGQGNNGSVGSATGPINPWTSATSGAGGGKGGPTSAGANYAGVFISTGGQGSAMTSPAASIAVGYGGGGGGSSNVATPGNAAAGRSGVVILKALP